MTFVANTAWNLWNYRLALLKTLEASGFGVFLLAPDDGYRTRLEIETRAQFTPLHHLSRRSFSLRKNLRFFLELRRCLRTQQPDLVLLYTLKPNILGNLAAASLGLPVVSVIEGLGYSASASPWLRILIRMFYRISLRFARQVVFLNADDQAEMLQRGLVKPQQAVTIHGPGIDLGHFRPVPRLPTNNHMVFLFVGRLLREKGLREFVEAAYRLKRQGIEAEFQVLGSPDPENPTSYAAEELALWQKEGVVQFLGYVDDVRPVIAAADAVVLPSYYREGVPRALLEGMAMEKIIVTTDMPGCRDTVDEGKNGFLTPFQNAPALAETLRKVLDLTPEERQAFGAHSRKKVEAEFSDAAVLPRYLRLIECVLQ